MIHAAIWNGDTNTFGSKEILSCPGHATGRTPTHGDAIDIDFVLGGANAGEAVAVWGTGAVYCARSGARRGAGA